jgi:predicted ATPase/class 3 adenylate cyclase
MAVLPTGTVTFLFTDLAVSTRLWDLEPDAMQAALARHDEILREGMAAHGGQVVKGRGDGVHAVFVTADAAVRAAIDCELAMDAEAWVVSEPLRARMGIHTGVAELRDGDYFGSAVNRAARLEAIAHGGQIVCSQATADLARDDLPEGVSLLDLGEHRLRDLSRPERVFQVIAPPLRTAFEPLLSLDSFPGNLPLQVNSFVGRERELAGVVSALEADRVVTLTGVGGVGKTRLALHAAAEVLPRFRDGAWLCELASVRDSGGVVAAAAGVFGVTERPALTLEQSLVAFLRDQQLVLVLDNCEHLLDGAAQLAETLEASCRAVVVLATSREPLAIDGERVLGVRSLGIPDGDASFDDVVSADAVRLFVDRAQAVKDDFVVSNANAMAVIQVCERLDGVPLAIELAAARVTAMNPAELAQRLDRRFEVLAGGRRRAVERHQTLRAAIDWSYELLSEPEQRLLARLAVFAGGCTVEAAEAVCAGESIAAHDVFELLAGLVARSLVVADDTGPETRYRLLETIRQYGEERLAEAGDTDRLRRRHVGYFIEFVRVVRGHVWGSGQIEWAARLAREHDNLLSAMAFALDIHDADLAFGLFCEIPGLIAFGVQINDLVVFDPTPLLALPGATEHPGSAVALMGAAFETWQRGDTELALTLSEEALAAERRLGVIADSNLAMNASFLRGTIAQQSGTTDEAIESYVGAVHRARAADLPGVAAVYLAFAAIALSYADPASAREYASDALTLARESGAPSAIVTARVALAQALVAEDPAQAQVELVDALESATSLGYESPAELQVGVFAAARLGAWPTVLSTTGRMLYHYARSGSIPRYIVVGLLNLVARGLAEQQPEPAAILQGAANATIRHLTPRDAAPVSGTRSNSNDVAAFVVEVRRGTTQLLIEALGETRLRQLRAHGEAMDQDQACAYARAQINEHLANVQAPV